jgi:hypothetical protein
MFRLSVKLLNILHGILETIYLNFQSQPTEKPSSRNVELIRKILNLNHQLDEFLTSMPERLSIFITLAASSGRGSVREFSMHEQALITRSVLTLSSEDRSLFSSPENAQSPNDVKIPLCPDNALTTIDASHWQ